MRVLLLFILFNPWLLLAQDMPENESCSPFDQINEQFIGFAEWPGNKETYLNELNILKQQKHNYGGYYTEFLSNSQYYSKKNLIKLAKDSYGDRLLRIVEDKHGDTIILITLQEADFGYADSNYNDIVIHTYLIFNKGKFVKTYAFTEDGRPYYISWKMNHCCFYSAYSVLYNNNGWIIGRSFELKNCKDELQFIFDDKGYLLSARMIYSYSLRYDTLTSITYKYSRAYDSIEVRYCIKYLGIDEHLFFIFDANGNLIERSDYNDDNAFFTKREIWRYDKKGKRTHQADCINCKQDLILTNWREYGK